MQKIEFNNFPIFEENNFIEKINLLTPVQKLYGVLSKRDDLFSIGGFNGGKVRQCAWIVYNHLDEIKSKYSSGLITACGLPSPQSCIVSGIARYFGLKCAVVVPKYKDGKIDYDRINTSISQKMGAEVYGSNNPRPMGVEFYLKDINRIKNYYQIKFGMESSLVIDIISNQCQNLPENIDNLILCGGSGFSLCGIVKGLIKFNKNVKNIYIVYFSKNLLKNIQNWLPKNNFNINYIVSEIPYKKYTKINNDFNLDLTYESKAFNWMINNIKELNNSLFWCVGIKNYDMGNIEKINWAEL